MPHSLASHDHKRQAVGDRAHDYNERERIEFDGEVLGEFGWPLARRVCLVRVQTGVVRSTAPRSPVQQQQQNKRRQQIHLGVSYLWLCVCDKKCVAPDLRFVL